jgi:REP element-mobilizing transposase RayT
MSKRNIVFIPGQYYHIYNRGANRGLIFRSQDNYDFLLRRIREYSIKTQATIVAYCLMPNHYHFLIRQDSEKPVSEFIQALFNSYTKAFNKMYGRTGTLFEGPYKANAVEKYEYLLYLCRYIHRNPLDAGLVTHPADWKHSNYLEWIGKRSGIETDMKFVNENFPNPLEYEEFVLNYLPPAKTSEVIK